MPRHNTPRKGSIQFWPRRRASKLLAGVNWQALSKDSPGFSGFIAYKAGMKSALVKDDTPESMTKGKKIIIPVTILEVPPMKIFSVRFYKNNRVMTEIAVSQDKELKKIVKISKQKKGIEDIDKIKDYDDIRVIIYSQADKTAIKKTPDIAEIAIGGKKEEKLELVRKFANKDILVEDIIPAFTNKIVDIRGVTKGHGTQGPVKRFGIHLRQHKSEKGVRKVGSIGPWHPAHISFRVPMAGQTGFFERLVYNGKILSHGKIAEKDINPKEGFKHFGKIKSGYLILKGSVQGPQKRQLLLTRTLRASKSQAKLNYEFLELR